MAFVGAAVITQSADALTLTFTDQSTGIGTLISRTLVITDSNGVVVNTIAMGASLTATQAITADVYYTFTETIVDNTGTLPAVVKNYSSIQFYNLAQAKLASVLNQGCNCTGVTCSSIVKARECINSALTFTAIGDGQSAQTQLTNADFYINNPYY